VNNWWNHEGHFAKLAPVQQKMSWLSTGIVYNIK